MAREKTLNESLYESGFAEVARDMVEDVIYAWPETPSLKRFKSRIGSMRRGYTEYRYRVYTRLLRLWRRRYLLQ